MLGQRQRWALQVNQGDKRPTTGTLGDTECSWNNFPSKPQLDYQAHYLAAPQPGGTATAAIDGRATTEVPMTGLAPRLSCVYQVQLSPARTLWVRFANFDATIPGLNHAMACTKALAATQAMVDTAIAPK